MVSFSPLSRIVPLPIGLNGLEMGVTNYLLTGMILQVAALFHHRKSIDFTHQKFP